MKEIEQQIDDAVAEVIKALKWFDGFHVGDAKHAAQTIYLSNRRAADAESKQAIEFFGSASNLNRVLTTSRYVKKIANGIKQELKALSEAGSLTQKEQFVTHLLKYFSDFTNFVVYLVSFNISVVKKSPNKIKAVVSLLLKRYGSILFTLSGALVGLLLAISVRA
ncbi:hypothetical protein [Pseudoalteromonas pernae]|uniref:hypothetical protein n=1 Tax=Pseudoalteromonas pernae TaxID=3118054 RepID=UPI0032421889